MHKALEFTRRVVAMAKEEGLSCLIMCNGATGFVGDLPDIIGIEGSAAVRSEEAWTPDQRAMNYTFADMQRIVAWTISHPEGNSTISQTVKIPMRTKMEIEMDLNLEVEFNWSGHDPEVYIVSNLKDGTKQKIFGIRFIEDSMRNRTIRFDHMIQQECSGTWNQFPIDTKIADATITGIPSHIGSALTGFMMHWVSLASSRCMYITYVELIDAIRYAFLHTITAPDSVTLKIPLSDGSSFRSFTFIDEGNPYVRFYYPDHDTGETEEIGNLYYQNGTDMVRWGGSVMNGLGLCPLDKIVERSDIEEVYGKGTYTEEIWKMLDMIVHYGHIVY